MSSQIVSPKNTNNIFRKFLVCGIRYYFRIGFFTFSLVSGSNIATTCWNFQRETNTGSKFLITEPKMYFTTLAIKSSMYGVFWPAFYLSAIRNPRDVFFMKKYHQNSKSNSKSTSTLRTNY